jgi:glycosyltransferase involved in cell wall biosynthesis
MPDHCGARRGVSARNGRRRDRDNVALLSLGVTCVVLVHNGERYVGAAIESILAQTHRPLEVVVVDNASTDASAAVAREFGEPVRVLHRDDRRQAAGRNLGIRAARFPLVAFLDADDLFRQTKLERQVARFVARPELELSLCTAENFWEESLADEQRRYEALGRTRATHAWGTALVRRDVFDRVGMIDESRLHGDHLEWFMRAAEAGVVVEVLPDVLMLRRMHPDSVSHSTNTLDPYLDFVHELIAKRRAQAAGTT